MHEVIHWFGGVVIVNGDGGRDTKSGCYSVYFAVR